jgi:hypothetical protein
MGNEWETAKVYEFAAERFLAMLPLDAVHNPIIWRLDEAQAYQQFKSWLMDHRHKVISYSGFTRALEILFPNHEPEVFQGRVIWPGLFNASGMPQDKKCHFMTRSYRGLK